jgi:hypothetical protein
MIAFVLNYSAFASAQEPNAFLPNGKDGCLVAERPIFRRPVFERSPFEE